MPIYKKIVEEDCVVLVWKIEESLEELMEELMLQDNSVQRLQGMKSIVHQQGFLAIRHLLLAVGYTDSDLFYDQNGRPYLSDGRYISITHSFNFAAIIIADEVVGIDLEKKRDKIQRIAAKFCSTSELLTANDSQDPINTLTEIWCVKEAVYKMCNSRSLSFKENILTNLPYRVTVKDREFYKEMHYKALDFEDFMLVYTFER